MVITVSKGLHLKNRLAAQIQRMRNDIAAHNVTRVGSVIPLDLNETYSKLLSTTDALLDLKVALTKASVKVQAEIQGIGELRSWMAFLNTLPTSASVVMTDAYNRGTGMMEPTRSEYQVFLTPERKNELVQTAEREIDAHTEQLELFNAKTKIDVPSLDSVV